MWIKIANLETKHPSSSIKLGGLTPLNPPCQGEIDAESDLFPLSRGEQTPLIPLIRGKADIRNLLLP